MLRVSFAFIATGLLLAGFGEWRDGMFEWTRGHVASPWAWVWLGGLAFAESSFFPIPPDVLLVALCLLPENGWGAAMGLAGVCSVASVAGGAFGYWIGRRGGRPVLERLFSEEKIAFTEKVFQRYDVWAIAIAGFTPVPYKVFTIAGGAFRLGFFRFLIASAVSRSARFFIVAAICAAVGKAAKDFIEGNFALLTIAFIVLVIGGFVGVRLLVRRASREPTGE